MNTIMDKISTVQKFLDYTQELNNLLVSHGMNHGVPYQVQALMLAQLMGHYRISGEAEALKTVAEIQELTLKSVQSFPFEQYMEILRNSEIEVTQTNPDREDITYN